MERVAQGQSTNLWDREGELIARIIRHYHNVMMLATERVSSETTLAVAAVNSMAIEVETQALISKMQDLLSLTRTLKELWLFGPLRAAGEGEGEADASIARDARAVSELLAELEERRVRPAVEGAEGAAARRAAAAEEAAARQAQAQAHAQEQVAMLTSMGLLPPGTDVPTAQALMQSAGLGGLDLGLGGGGLGGVGAAGADGGLYDGGLGGAGLDGLGGVGGVPGDAYAIDDATVAAQMVAMSRKGAGVGRGDTMEEDGGDQDAAAANAERAGGGDDDESDDDGVQEVMSETDLGTGAVVTHAEEMAADAAAAEAGSTAPLLSSANADDWVYYYEPEAEEITEESAAIQQQLLAEQQQQQMLGLVPNDLLMAGGLVGDDLMAGLEHLPDHALAAIAAQHGLVADPGMAGVGDDGVPHLPQ